MEPGAIQKDAILQERFPIMQDIILLNTQAHATARRGEVKYNTICSKTTDYNFTTVQGIILPHHSTSLFPILILYNDANWLPDVAFLLPKH